MKYIKKGNVTTSIGDASGDISLLGTIQIIQDAVCNALGLINCDNITLKNKYNSMWVFSKNKCLFFKKLAWNEEYIVESFISKITKITAILDTVIYNKNNEICAYSKIETCPLDKETKRFKRLTEIGIPLDFVCDKEIMSFDFDRFNIQPDFKIRSIIVESTNLDMSMHTNNAEYVRIISNCYKADELINMQKKEFSIWYTKETKEGANLDIYKKKIDDSDYFIIKDGDNIAIKAIVKY